MHCPCRHKDAVEHRKMKAGLKAGIDKGRERQRAVVTGLMPTLLLAALWLIMESIPAVKFPSLLNMMAAVCVAPQVSTLAMAADGAGDVVSGAWVQQRVAWRH